METRLAVGADSGALAVLHARCFGDAFWSEEQLRTCLQLATTKAWLIATDTAPAALIICQNVGPECEILTFCVDPEAQRKGLGQSLLRTAMAVLTAHGGTRLYLEVAADNTPALGLYWRCGFERTGIRKGYYRRLTTMVDAFLLEASLSP